MPVLNWQHLVFNTSSISWHEPLRSVSFFFSLSIFLFSVTSTLDFATCFPWSLSWYWFPDSVFLYPNPVDLKPWPSACCYLDSNQYSSCGMESAGRPTLPVLFQWVDWWPKQWLPFSSWFQSGLGPGFERAQAIHRPTSRGTILDSVLGIYAAWFLWPSS